MSEALKSHARIRREALFDPARPVHRIAEQLLPYLEVLVDRFDPEEVVLFGSYAYGEPGPDSDVDLLVVKRIEQSPISDATQIRRAVRPIRGTGVNLPLDIMVRAPRDFQERVRRGADFHSTIAREGLVLVK